MVKNFRDLHRTWVLASATSPASLLGKVVDIVIDPGAAQCVALWIKTMDGLRLIDFRDIHKWIDNKIFIPSQHDVLKSEEFPRISAILEKEVAIISAEVFVREGEDVQRIGRVEDFVFQIEFPIILGIVVNTGWWIFGKKIEIPRSRILEINEKGIFVSSNLVKSDPEVDSNILPSLD